MATVRFWADPDITAIGRLPMHTLGSVPFASGRRRYPLDGTWRFARFAHPDQVPVAAVAEREPRRGTPWRDIEVPGNWTLQDTVDRPHYTNVQMPWALLPPALPAEIPTGVYRTTFRVPDDEAGWQPVLHLGGAESVHTVYVNGSFVGYGTDSRLPSEYDLTPFVGEGENTLAVVVARYSAHSYVEDQDQWWMAGLHREVFLEMRPPTFLADVVLDAGLADDLTTGTLRVMARAARGDGRAVERDCTVRVELFGPNGRRVGRVVTAPVARDLRPYVFTGTLAEVSMSVPAVSVWSAETPDRYRVGVSLHSAAGEVLERAEIQTGFRRVEVKDRALLVNGRRVMIHGVNRHDHHPDRGKAVTLDDMRADLLAMKRHNVNAVRCSHYPNDPQLLDLCDELGLYVVDEANIESHAFNTSLCHDPRYRSAWLERGARMVQRDRNHPSVVLWSLGNESGYGENHDALAAWIRRVDPSRPLHYEGAVFHAGWIDGGLLASDLVCPMYAPIDAIVAYGRAGLGTRPLILCEYSHAMGNSNGSLSEYAEAFETTPGLQGGFVWEWKDHGIRQALPDGRKRLAYGGQFGDSPNDGNFVADGLMSAELEPHPAMRELMWCSRPVSVTLAGGRRARGESPAIAVTNRQRFRDLRGLRAEWELSVDGVRVRGGRLRVPEVAPEATVAVPLPCALPDGGGEAHLSVRWFSRRDEPWAPAGHLVAWDQVVLRPTRSRPARSRRVPAGGPWSGADGTDPFPVEPTVWRAAIDNDGFKLMPDFDLVGSKALSRWRTLGFDQGLGGIGHRADVRTEADGAVVVRHRFVVPEACTDPPRLGVRTVLPTAFGEVRWFGRGPHENYPDRQASAMLGVWSGPPDELPYLVPQEFGLRTDCRWVEFRAAGTGAVIRIEAVGRPFHFSATHHTAEQLFAARDSTELERTDGLVVHLDGAHRGLGTASCGPDVRDQYRIGPGSHELTYRVRRLGD